MFTLFNTWHNDTNVTPEEHGRRLGTFYLCQEGDDNEYLKLRNVQKYNELLAVAH